MGSGLLSFSAVMFSLLKGGVKVFNELNEARQKREYKME